MTDQRDLAKEVEAISRAHKIGLFGESMVDEYMSTLLAFIASQSRELEELRQLVCERPDQEAIDVAVSRAELAERELAAVRRPVQSESAELIRAKLEGEYEGSSSDAETLVNELFGDIRTLLSALDQAQRENRRLAYRVDQFEAVPGMQQMEFIRAELNDAKRFAFADHPLQPSMAKTVLACADQLLVAYNERCKEIARLSSPPEERGEIVELFNRERRSYQGSLLDAIDTLLGDCAAWRNAHALVTRERDHARQSLKQESELHQARKDLVTQLTSELDEARGKVERLEQRGRENDSQLFVVLSQRDSNREAYELAARRSQAIVDQLILARERIDKLEGALRKIYAGAPAQEPPEGDVAWLMETAREALEV